jgi:hypothetical protein
MRLFAERTFLAARAGALAAVLVLGGLAGTASAQAVHSIRWPGKDTAGGLVVGPPDMRSAGVSPSSGVTALDFRCATQYANLAALLHVAPDVLARADVIAFELNGGSPGENGGWESADWLFSDGVTSYHVAWDAVANRAAPAEALLANGSLTDTSYRAYFGIADGGPAPSPVVSYQLLRLPAALRTDSTAFRVTVSGYASGEGTPDPEAIGVLTRPCSF